MRESNIRKEAFEKMFFFLWTKIYLRNAIVNFYVLTWLGHRCPDIWSNIIVGVSVKLFHWRLTFESTDWVKQFALHSELTSSNQWEYLQGTKELSKRDFFLPDFLELGHQVFAAFGRKLKHLPFLDLKPAGFQTRTYITVSLDPQALQLGLELQHHLF